MMSIHIRPEGRVDGNLYNLHSKLCMTPNVTSKQRLYQLLERRFKSCYKRCFNVSVASVSRGNSTSNVYHCSLGSGISRTPTIPPATQADITDACTCLQLKLVYLVL